MQDVVLHQVGAQQLLYNPWQHHHHKLYFGVSLKCHHLYSLICYIKGKIMDRLILGLKTTKKGFLNSI